MKISSLKNKSYNPNYDKQNPNDRAGNYYVSAVDGDRFALLLGPFKTHEEALKEVDNVNKKACEVDSKACFYGFGTVKVDDYNKPGVMNHMF